MRAATASSWRTCPKVNARKNVPSVEHTRLPGYLRDHVGIVDTVYPGLYTYLTNTGPDGVGEAMPVYCVQFDPQTIWKGNTDAKAEIYADLYEAYLETVN